MTKLVLEKDEVFEILLLLKNCFDKKNIRSEKYKNGVKLELTVGDFTGITDRNYLYTAQNFLNKRSEFFKITFDFQNESPLMYVDGVEITNETDVPIAYLYGKNVLEIKNKVLYLLKKNTKKALKEIEHLPKDFRWEKLKIIFVDEQILFFKYEDTSLCELSLSDIGIRDSKKGIKSLFVSFFFMDRNSPIINDLLSSKINKNQANKSNLKKLLCKVFKTTSDPFYINIDSPDKNYSPKFKTSVGGEFLINEYRSGSKLNENQH
jgi:hypothetical protein